LFSGAAEDILPGWNGRVREGETNQKKHKNRGRVGLRVFGMKKRDVLVGNTGDEKRDRVFLSKPGF